MNQHFLTKTLACCLLVGPVDAQETQTNKMEANTDYTDALSVRTEQGERENALRSALAQAEALAPEDPRLAKSLNALAVFCHHQGRLTEAESLYRRALELLEKKPAADSVKLVIALNNLARLYLEEGKYDEVEGPAKRALAVGEQALGQEHPQRANTLTILAEFYTAHDRYTEAETLYH